MENGRQGTIVMSRDEFGDELWNSVGKMLKLLTESGYQCKIHQDEPAFNIVVIDYNYDERLEWGDKIVLMSMEEFEDYELWKRSQIDDENLEND